MDEELESYHKSNAELDKMIGELRDKLDEMQKSIMIKRREIGDEKGNILKMKNDLYDCVQHVQV